MSTEAAVHLLTAEEFCGLPDPIEGGKMELVRGEVVTHMPVGGTQFRVTGRIIKFLVQFAELHALGEAGPELGVVLKRDPDIVLAPDVAFIRQTKLPGGVLPEGFIEGAPTLAVEVISPNDRENEVSENVDLYLAFGTDRVWVVRPRLKTVTVHHPDRTSHTLHVGEWLTSADAGFGVDGFELSLDELFS